MATVFLFILAIFMYVEIITSSNLTYYLLNYIHLLSTWLHKLPDAGPYTSIFLHKLPDEGPYSSIKLHKILNIGTYISARLYKLPDIRLFIIEYYTKEIIS